ncbi:MAG: cation:proton antiporter [Acidobacteriota bacterium]
MPLLDLLLLASALFLFALFSRRLTDRSLTAPMVFLLLGIVVGRGGLGWFETSLEASWLHLLAELALVLVLFADATRIDLGALRRESGLPVRMLLVGLPLTVVLGTGLMLVILPELGLWSAALLAAILAPTDAALGQSVVSSPAVPLRLRQALNVESGLNDGLMVPVIHALAASAVMMTSDDHGSGLGSAAIALLLGPLVGVVLGGLGAVSLTWVRRREWIEEGWAPLVVLALALGAWALAETVHGNGFLAAFVGGLTFGWCSRGREHQAGEFVETQGQLLTLTTFFLLGALLWPVVVDGWSPRTLLAALAMLTIARALPVTFSLLGTGLKPRAFLFLAWFGPRGLASVVFVILIHEHFHLPGSELVLETVLLTVVLSTLLHGMSAAPAARAHGRLSEEEPCPAEEVAVHEHPLGVRTQCRR